MPLEEIHLALESGAHGAARAVDHVARFGAALAAQLGELAKPGLEHALEAADGMAVVHRALVERVEVVAAPEIALKLVGLHIRAPDREPLLEDEHPRHERHREQQEHHHLDDNARVEDQRPDVEVLGYIHSNARCSSSGIRAGLMRSRCTIASVTSASTSSSVSRSTRWPNTRLARPILTTSADTDSMSLRRAGAWKRALSSCTRKSSRRSSAIAARSSPLAFRSSVRARSMNARYCAWNTTPPASVSW